MIYLMQLSQMDYENHIERLFCRETKSQTEEHQN